MCKPSVRLKQLPAAILLLLALAGCASDRVAVERYEIRVSEDGREIIAEREEKERRHD